MTTPTTRYLADAVVTCDGEGAVYQPGAVDVSGTTISCVGPVSEAPAYDGPTRRLDGLLMPGFVNAHAHAPMTLFRGAAEGVTLDAFLREVLWPRERRLTAEDVYWGTTLACAEMQRAGVTTSCEMYFHEEAMLAAFVDAGSRCVLTPGVFEMPDWELFASWEKRLAGVTAFLDAHQEDDPLVELGIAAHSAYALSLEGLGTVAAAAQERGALLHFHLAESRDETRALEEAAGRTLTALLAERGFFNGRVLAAHGVWLSDDDLAVLAAHDVAIAHCPQSNAKLAVGTARLQAMRRAGLRVGLGTDGPASNNRLDLWLEMKVAALTAAAATGQAGALSPAAAVALATRGGAEALGRADLGVLAPGCQADLVLVRTDDAAFVPVLEPADLLAHLVWAASSALVSDVWIAGEQVVRAGECVRIDVAQARREVQQRAARLRSS